MPTRGDDDLALVLAARDGDATAFGALFDRWFDRVFDVSFRILHDRELAAEVAQDVFLVGWQQLATLRQPGSFGGWLLRMSRNRSLNRVERERRSVALGDEGTTAVIDRRAASPDASEPVEQSEQVDLVWAAAAALGERDASVLDLHLRHGFGAAEIAEALDVTTNNAHQLLFRLKDRLRGAIRGWVLWSDGSPSCPSLQRALVVAGVERFGADAVKVIDRHARSCDECEERRTLRLAPEAMFAAVPIAVAGPFLRAEAAAALAEAGVPMEGSSALGDPGAEAGPGDGREGDHSDGRDAGGSEGSGDVPEPVRATARLYAAMAIVALLVVAAAVVAIADSVGDGTGEVAFAPVDTVVSTTTTERVTTTSTTLAPTTVTTAVPETVPPATQPPSTAPPVVTPPPPPPPAPPTILTFSGARTTAPGTCESFQPTFALTWRSEDGLAATLSGPGAPSTSFPASGTTVVCVPGPPFATPPYTYTLTVTGPGGSTSRVLSVS